MTIDEKKAYLMRYRANEREVERLMEELTRWRSRAEKMGAEWGASPGGGEGEGFPACVEKIHELQNDLSTTLINALKLRKEILSAIETVQEPQERLVLKWRYIQGETWKNIGKQMHYEERQVRRIHERALHVLACPGESMILLR